MTRESGYVHEQKCDKHHMMLSERKKYKGFLNHKLALPPDQTHDIQSVLNQVQKPGREGALKPRWDLLRVAEAGTDAIAAQS